MILLNQEMQTFAQNLLSKSFFIEILRKPFQSSL